MLHGVGYPPGPQLHSCCCHSVLLSFFYFRATDFLLLCFVIVLCLSCAACSLVTASLAFIYFMYQLAVTNGEPHVCGRLGRTVHSRILLLSFCPFVLLSLFVRHKHLRAQTEAKQKQRAWASLPIFHFLFLVRDCHRQVIFLF